MLRQKSQNGKIEVLIEQVYLWHRQALALKRSSRHLEKIEQLIDQAKNNLDSRISISVRDCGAMVFDQQEFITLAFELIDNYESSKQS